VRLRIAVRTILAALAALLAATALSRAAGLPGGVVVIATVVAVMVSRTLHATSLAHRLSALLHVPLISVLAAFAGRVMLHHAWLGAGMYVAAVGASRYLLRFGGAVRRFGRLALTPLIAVLVVPVPPSAAQATGPLWGAVAGAIAVACVLLSQAALPARPTREAAAAALALIPAARRVRALPPDSPRRTRATRTLHRVALTAEDRLAAATRLPQPAPLAALSTAVLRAEVLAQSPPPAADAEDGAIRAVVLGAGAGSGGSDPVAPEAAALAGAAPAGAAPAGAGPAVAPGAGAGGGAVGSAAPAISPTAVGVGAGTGSGEVAHAVPAARGGDGAAGHDGESLPAGEGAAQGAPSPAGDPLAAALAEVEATAAAVRAIPARERPAGEPPRPPARKGVHPHTRLSAQLAVAMAAAFAAGHLLFPHHWTWTVITAFVVCGGARSRGDVVHRSGLRVAGAFAGAVTGTFVARLVTGAPPAAVAVIFCYLLVGVWLRDVSYAVWAFCVTSLLAVLYSLDGEHGSALLVQRPEGILAGSACGILAAYFVLPLRTETVMRGRAARALQVLQDLLAAVREPDPEPAALRHLSRDLDRAARDLADAAASARAHRTLFARRRPGVATHAADWADTLALCVSEARALAATAPGELAAARRQLGLTARNLGQVRRRLGHRPDAQPPRPPAGAGPAPLYRLNAALTRLYAQLPA
jgi:hypothetical protein